MTSVVMSARAPWALLGATAFALASFVLIVRGVFVALFVSLTAASATIAPEESVTIPAMLAATCACAVCKEIAVKTITATRNTLCNRMR